MPDPHREQERLVFGKCPFWKYRNSAWAILQVEDFEDSATSSPLHRLPTLFVHIILPSSHFYKKTNRSICNGVRQCVQFRWTHTISMAIVAILRTKIPAIMATAENKLSSGKTLALMQLLLRTAPVLWLIESRRAVRRTAPVHQTIIDSSQFSTGFAMER
jgi:hypothetical protein